MTDERPASPISSITKDTLVPLGGALFIAWTLFSAFGKYGDETRAKADAVSTRVAAVEQELAAVRRQQAASAGDRWTCSDHERFVLSLRVANPNIVIPARHKRCAVDEFDREGNLP